MTSDTSETTETTESTESTDSAVAAPESKAPSISAVPAPPPPAEKPMKWYAVHTYSGYEGRVRDSLAQRMVQFSLESHFGEVLIPSETTSETLSSGKTRVRNKVSYPGYVFVEMRMSEQAWHLVKDTPRVIGFIGNQTPREVSAAEIDGVRRGMHDGTVKPKPRMSFNVGEEVRVLDGAFANFTGTVDEVSPEKQKLKVIVSIFGRPTSVELDFSMVERR